MYYEEMRDALGLIWFRTSPKGSWSLKIPEFVEKDISKRWENGQPHHEQSIALVKAIQHIDNTYCRGMFDLETGGDGDNGENLLYLLDIMFEAQ